MFFIQIHGVHFRLYNVTKVWLHSKYFLRICSFEPVTFRSKHKRSCSLSKFIVPTYHFTRFMNYWLHRQCSLLICLSLLRSDPNTNEAVSYANSLCPFSTLQFSGTFVGIDNVFFLFVLLNLTRTKLFQTNTLCPHFTLRYSRRVNCIDNACFLFVFINLLRS